MVRIGLFRMELHLGAGEGVAFLGLETETGGVTVAAGGSWAALGAAHFHPGALQSMGSEASGASEVRSWSINRRVDVWHR